MKNEVKKTKKEFNKVFNYRDFNFNIKVILNNVNDWPCPHKIIINDMGNGNWFFESFSDHLGLKKDINNIEMEAKKYVEGKLLSQFQIEEIILQDLGFE